MAYYIFRSGKELEWFAITEDERGTCLPHNLGPWWHSADTEMPLKASLLERNRIQQVIKTNGFYLFRASPSAHKQEEP